MNKSIYFEGGSRAPALPPGNGNVCTVHFLRVGDDCFSKTRSLNEYDQVHENVFVIKHVYAQVEKHSYRDPHGRWKKIINRDTAAAIEP